MEKFFVLFYMVFSLSSYSQKNERDIFSTLSLEVLNGTNKPTFFYTVASWCGQNLEDIKLISDTLKKYRKSYNLIIFLDSNLQESKQKYYKLVLDLKPEKIVSLNKYFPTCFIHKKEARGYAKSVNNVYGTKLKIIGPSTLFVTNNKNITFFSIEEKCLELSNYIKRIL